MDSKELDIWLIAINYFLAEHNCRRIDVTIPYIKYTKVYM